jgi:dTDP-4-amino-4,6-dideoxy-D-galactose acyltransferase
MTGPLTDTDALLVAARAQALSYYSPISFLREVAPATQQLHYGTGPAAQFGQGKDEEVLAMGAEGHGQWLVQALPWDTEFFGTPTFRLFTGLFPEHATPGELATAAYQLRQTLAKRGSFYAFGVVPAEDTRLIQALTGGGWHLVETRLNFYRPTAEPVPQPAVAVRNAQPEESEHIGRISGLARNDFDRFHADPWFGNRGDALLTRYAEVAVKGGYADAVLVPDEPGVPVDSFLAIGDTMPSEETDGIGFSRVLLTAVGPANRGWHIKLVAETVRRAAKLDLPYVVMTTQATNRAVFRTCEKLGFRLGSTTHVFACHAPE